GARVVARWERGRASVGAEGMVGAIGVARGRLAPVGPVLLRGEYWTAESDEVVDVGERVEVTAVDGLRLRVRRARPAGRGKEAPLPGLRGAVAMVLVFRMG